MGVERLPREFYRLWVSFTVSQGGSAVGMGALPLLAIVVVGASDMQVSMMAAVAGIVSAVVALPMGPFIEGRRKRPVMVWAELGGFAGLVSVAVAGWFGVLTYGQLCVVVVVQAVCGIVFAAASGAYLKGLVPEAQWVRANSLFESTYWTCGALGPPLGGVLMSIVGATSTVIIDAISYLVSALGIRTIAGTELAPEYERAQHHWMREMRSGWSYIFGRPVLGRLFWNAMLFGGSLSLSVPLVALLMLRELGYSPWQYGLALGPPCVGGLLGSFCAPRFVSRFGVRAVLLGFGTLRTCWLGLMLLAGPDLVGLIVIVTADALLLFCAGVFNPVFAACRMKLTADDHMARVGTAWSISAKCWQPAFIALGGVLAGATSTRIALGVAAVVLLGSAVLLPWRQFGRDEAGSAFEDPFEAIA